MRNDEITAWSVLISKTGNEAGEGERVRDLLHRLVVHVLLERVRDEHSATTRQEVKNKNKNKTKFRKVKVGTLSAGVRSLDRC